jgi:hypothetical protein
VTPPRMPPGAEGALYAEYVVAILSALRDARDELGEPVPGNRERAAATLGIPVRTLSRHIDALGLADLCGSEAQSALWPRSGRQPRRQPQPG